MVAKVNTDECTACGICIDECPSTAIELKNEKATVDEVECTDCGTCMDACPNSAITVDK